MFKVIATDAIVSKGYEGAPALKYGEKGDSVRFRIGWKVYDSRAENNTRWVNINVKAFGTVCERIRKMKLKECSWISLSGRLDEDVWTDERTGEVKSAMVIILDDIEYASGGGGKKEQRSSGEAAHSGENEAPVSAAAPEENENFTGYEPFGGSSFFDEE